MGEARLYQVRVLLRLIKPRRLVEQGEEIPYQQATSSGATSVSFQEGCTQTWK